MIGNLLQNAAKFTPRGGKATRLGRVGRERGGGARVRDTGSGIEPEMSPRLFETFAQAEQTLDRSKGGLGLGLALVKGLVELHGGAVERVERGPGRGAAFTVRLPLDAIAALQALAEPRAAPGACRAACSSSRTTRTPRTACATCSSSTSTASRSRTAAGRASRRRGAFRPDVVLCDIGLPEMDGYAVARAMRADPELGRVGLVAVSGYTQPEDVAIATEAGFDTHLRSPPASRS